MFGCSQKKWWYQLYDKNLADILLENTDSLNAKKIINFLQQELGLHSGQKVLDQCCGTGRLALQLAKQHEVVGVDIVPEYIELAAKKANKHKLEIQLYCDDAFNFALPKTADVAINWWTSFGYTADDNLNLQMINRAYESLKVEGHFALDFMNVPKLYRDFQADVMTKIKRNNNCEELVLVRHSEIDFEHDILKKDWYYFIEEGERVHYQSEVKLYSPAQLMSLFEVAGFSRVRLFGDVDGQPLSLDSPRCIVVGQRL
ncbi:class I SAM-dependent methyltransferase [Spartinivicinus ruber]|uniref:class I SAM-dependent methyltransferase n=1 Tax=Spartinivicinus ruber TaxID=2683272 RepID=UPI0013D35FF5|nr:class I SAM-dependent methyltransferase [Spartinivicinus ruber]